MTSKLGKLLDGIPLVDIPDAGTFNYILLKLTIKSYWQSTSDNEHILVRGFVGCDHSTIFERVHKKLTKKFGKKVYFDLQCLGGGNIKHDPGTIIVCGNSQRYGGADHEVTTNLLKTRYEGEGYEIVFSNSILDPTVLQVSGMKVYFQP